MVGFALLGVFRTARGRLAAGTVSQAIAFASDLDEFGMVQEAVEDGRGGRDVADQFAPIFQAVLPGHGTTGLARKWQ